MKDKLTLQQKEDILTGKGKTSGKYCNAIDENPYDSSEWTNYMPASGWKFFEDDDGRVSVYYEQVFACYDGWDSHVDDDSTEYFDNKEQAVNCIWARKSVDKIYDFIESLKNSAKIEVEQDSTIRHNVKTELEVESLPYNNGTRCQRNTFDMSELLNNLIENVYPILKGASK